jgi:TatA/E family protein of Tat protein translocase
MPPLGPVELVLLLGIVIVIFGAGRLSELGGALGKGIREFRRSSDVATTPATLACPSCAAEWPAGQAFCGRCGTRLASLRKPAA